MRILTNHLGYATKATKIAILQSKEAIGRQNLIIVDPDDNVVATLGSNPIDAVDGWTQGHFHTIDFTNISQKGTYTLRLVDKPSVQSWPFVIEDSYVSATAMSDLLFYFKGQRASGIYDRKDKKANFVNHPGPGVDVSGGWYDASGDLSKYFSHLSYANFMNPQQIPLVVYNFALTSDLIPSLSGPKLPGLKKRTDEEAAHGGDFLVRMLAPEGYFYMTIFDRWSKDINQREICSYSTQKGLKHETWQASYRQGGGLAIAALARLGTQQNGWGEYSPAAYLTAAQKAFINLNQFGPSYCDDQKENIIDDYCALLAASELANAAHTLNDSQKHVSGIRPLETYLEVARLRAQKLIDRLVLSGDYQGWLRADDGSRPYFHASDAGLPAIALLRYLEVENDQGHKDKAIQALRTILGFELGLAQEVENPFGLARQYVWSPGTANRSTFFIPHENESGYWWQGENARLGSLATAALWAARAGISGSGHAAIPKQSNLVLTRDKLVQYAQRQIDWILGFNPYDMCMLQGRGHNNPEYLDTWPNAPGGVCNGITAGFSDEHDIAFKPDSHKDDGFNNWRWGEQWIPHGSWLFAALTYLASAE